MTRVTRFANLYGLCDGLHGEPGAFVRALSLSCSKDVDVFLNFRGLLEGNELATRLLCLSLLRI